MKRTTKLILGAALCAAAIPGAQAATQITINSGLSAPATAKVFSEVVASFEADHPDINVKVNHYDQEAEKTAIRGWLVANPPDLVNWFPGTRMRFFVDHGLFADVSDVWKELDLQSRTSPAVLEQISVNGKQYGVPYTHYMWGLYYRKDTFEKYGLTPPKTWDQLLSVSKTLKDKGAKPFALGDKALWPAAGWFDYLDMRINGYAFHQKLTHGEIPYTDPRVKDVFEHWATLLKNDYFTPKPLSYTWQEAQRFFFNGQAGMLLIGSFMAANIPDDQRDNIGFVRFPAINPDVALAEDAPINIFAIPSKAKHKAAAKEFLAYLVKPKVQTKLAKAIFKLPVVNNAEAPDNPLMEQQYHILSQVKHTAQFFDVDSQPEMAKYAMTQFQRFLAYPDQIDPILKKLERKRQRVYK